MWWLLGILVVTYCFYKYVMVPRSYWKERGVPFDPPLPFFGNFYPIMSRQQSFFHYQGDVYKKFPNDRYCGNFQLATPTLFVRDLDLIKQIGVKDFDHFTDHRTITSSNDTLFYKNLIVLKGDEWREMRAFLSPTFTSSKMKGMFELMSACARRVTNHFLELNKKSDEIEVKDLFTRYANDVIATCAFGVECDSLRYPDNDFYLNGKDALNFGGIRGIKAMLANFIPGLFKLLNMRLFPKSFSDFFINCIKDSIEHREKNSIIRPDVIHLLLEARKGKLKHDSKRDENDKGFSVVEESSLGKAEVRLDGITDVDIAAQCFIFYIAGFDTASSGMSFTLTELAINPEVQDKLFQEIDEAMKSTNGKITYDTVMKMKYLDMVISESLRKWPPAPSLDRLCVKDYHIPPTKPNEVPVVVKAGDVLAIPVIGIHKDPKYFPDPERFDPERFSDENKDKIVPYSYMPFGIGPRACIGSRFALLETKIILIEFLHKFEVYVIDKTSVPIALTTKSLKIAPDNGFWVGMKRR